MTGKSFSSWWLPDRSPSFSSRPVLQLGWATAKVTQPASDSLDSTQRSPGAAALSQMLLSNTVITSALAHALAPGWHLIWWHVVPLNTSRLAHSPLANQTGETTGVGCLVKMVPIKFNLISLRSSVRREIFFAVVFPAGLSSHGKRHGYP